jgi:hypothetical protein
MKNNQHEKLQALVKAGKLEHVPADLGFLAEQFESCAQIKIDVQALLENGSIQGAFLVGYTYIRKSATLLLYCKGVRPTARVDLASVERCVEIGDQLVAIAQSISS